MSKRFTVPASLALIAALMFLASAVLSAPPARNLIIIIVDGMGPAHRQLGELSSKAGFAMNHMSQFGIMGTSSSDLDITDSAAAATAMFCGAKTYNGMLGYDADLNELTSIMRLAKGKGYLTGIITTSALYDATCAAMYANEFDRNSKKSISAQLLLSGTDLLIGGGSSYIKPKASATDKDKQSAKPEAAVHHSLASFSASRTLPAICLLATEELTAEIDRQKDDPRLPDMVKEGLLALKAVGRPFLLLIESGTTDGFSHDNDAAGVLSELKLTDEAVAACLDFARKDGNTLVIVTADHETGGLSLGSGAGFDIDTSYLKTVKASASAIATEASVNWKALPSILLSKASYKQTADDGLELVATSADPAREIGRIISRNANIGWGTGWHTAVDVIVSAEGPGSPLFAGRYDNTELFGKMKAALGL